MATRTQPDNSPRATRFTRDGLDLVAVENDRVRLVFWPAHGCDVIEFRHKGSDCDALWKNPYLQPPRLDPLPLPHAGRSEFYDTFHGGWLLSIPACFSPCDYYGAPMGTLGEYAQLAWSIDDIREEPKQVSVIFAVHGVRTPFAITRRVTLRTGEDKAGFHTTVHNGATQRLPLVWIEHLLLGGPLLDGGRVMTAAGNSVVPPTSRPGLTQLQPDSTTAWPMARESTGGLRDLRQVPPRGSMLEHVVALEKFREGWGCLWNASLNLGFELRWDTEFFPRAWLWATGTGGADYPLWGSGHVLGLEPATSSPLPFRDLVERGEVRWIEAGAEIGTTLTAGFISREPAGDDVDSK